MKFLTKITCFITAVLLCFTNFSCKNKGSAVDLYYFNSPIHIETHGKVLESEHLNEIEQTLSLIEKEFNLSSNDSFLSKFNDGKANQPLDATSTAKEVLTIAKDCHAFTDGKFNPAVYPLIELWKFSDGYPVANFVPPSNDQISKILQDGVTDFNNVTLNEESVTKSTDQTKIDLGGIVKGYATDKVAEILLDNGYEKGYVSIGSSSLFILETQNLTIRHPRPTDDLNGIVKINFDGQKNLSVSTSGDYERYYTYQETTYSHLIDPSTGYPAKTGVVSATIIGADGAFSDAVTTALCLCSHQTDQTDSQLVLLMNKIISEYKDASIFVVFIDGNDKQILTNKKQGEYFDLLDKDYTVVNV